MPVFCVALCAGAVFSFSETEKTIASADSITVTANMQITDRQNYMLPAGEYTTQTITYSRLAGGGGSYQIGLNGNKISIYSETTNNRNEAVYVGFTVSVEVPAWKEYKITYPFTMAVIKYHQTLTTGSQLHHACEILYYGDQNPKEGDAYNATNANSGGEVVFGMAHAPNTSTGSGGAASQITHYSSKRTSQNVIGKETPVSHTITESYANRSDETKTFTLGFGFFANDSIASAAGTPLSLGISTKPTYLQLGTCTAEVKDLTVEAPEDVSMDYTGMTYTNVNLNTIGAITGATWYNAAKMNISLREGTAKDAGDYNLDVSLINTGANNGESWKLADGTFTRDTQTVKLTINKVDPIVDFGGAESKPLNTIKGTQDEFPKPTITYNGSPVEGELNWGSQMPEGDASGKTKAYSWTFTPKDTTNFNSKTGTVNLTFITPGIESVTATFDSKGNDVFVSTPVTTRNKYFTVKVKYDGVDGESEVEIFDVLNWKAGENVKVYVKVGSAEPAPVIIPKIGIDKIESLTAILIQGDTKITPDSTDKEIKQLLSVTAKWNYANTTKPLAADDYEIEFTPVVGLNKSTLTVKYKNTDDTVVKATPDGDLLVDKGDYKIPDSLFEDRTETHTGEPFDPTGWIDTTKLPKGMTVSYSCETDMTAVGEHVVKATFSNPDPDNYNDPEPKTATLTISDKNVYKKDNLKFIVTGAEGEGGAFTATYDPDTTVGVKLEGKLLDKDGNEVDETKINVSREYKYQKKVNGEWVDATAADLKNAGEYRVTVTVTTDDPTYDSVKMVAELTIDKATIELPEDIIKNEVAVNDGKPHKVEVKDLPENVKVKYVYDGKEQDEPFEFDKPGEYKVKAVFEPVDKDNYNDIDPVEVTLTISDKVVTGIIATLEEGAKFTTANTPDDLKAKIKAEIFYDDGSKEEVKVEDLSFTCTGLQDNGKFKAGLQSVTVTYNDGTQDFTAYVNITVNKEKVALPVYKGTLSYTGANVKPTADDFDGYDGEIMLFVEDKTVAGLNAGTYKAVFALTDTDNYEWASASALKKSVFAAAIYDVETEVQLLVNERAVDWKLEKAVITATQTEGSLPVFASESFKGALASVVGLKYYKDEACTQEVAAADLAKETQYYVKAALLDENNFELDASAAAFATVPFSYTTPAGEPTVWDKIVSFLKVNWLWLVIALVALILLITIIAVAARAAKKKREREERRLAEEKAERKREQEEREERRREEREERMARMNQQQAMPQMMMPPMMQMPQQMPQMQPQYASQPQPVSTVGGSVSEAQFMQMQAELAALKASQESAKEIAALKAELNSKELATLRNDVTYVKREGETASSGNVNLPVESLTEIITAAVKNALAGDSKPAQQPAEKAENGAASAATTQVPPDAVMTTVTTTKIDTTKKQAQSAARPVVRNYVAPMPVDDGRVFDVGGFYKPADPLTDMNLDEEEKKD